MMIRQDFRGVNVAKTLQHALQLIEATDSDFPARKQLFFPV